VGLNNGNSKFTTTQITENYIRLKKHGKAKLKYNPVISIDAVVGIAPSPFNAQTTVPVLLTDIWLQDLLH